MAKQISKSCVSQNSDSRPSLSHVGNSDSTVVPSSPTPYRNDDNFPKELYAYALSLASVRSSSGEDGPLCQAHAEDVALELPSPANKYGAIRNRGRAARDAARELGSTVRLVCPSSAGKCDDDSSFSKEGANWDWDIAAELGDVTSSSNGEDIAKCSAKITDSYNRSVVGRSSNRDLNVIY